MKKRPAIRIQSDTVAPTEGRPNNGLHARSPTAKTIYRPRTIEPRWARVPNPFYGDLHLGNGTEIRIGCFTNEVGKFFFGLVDEGCSYFVNLTNADEVGILLDVSPEDAGNIADFINSQLDVGMDPNEYEGTYNRIHCA